MEEISTHKVAIPLPLHKCILQLSVCNIQKFPAVTTKNSTPDIITLDFEKNAHKKISADGATTFVLSVDFSGCSCTINILELGKNLFSIDYRWKFTSEGKWRYTSDVSFVFSDSQLFIPSVFYKNNDRGEGKFYKTTVQDGIRLKEDRMPIPGCMAVYNHESAVFSCLSSPNHAQEALLTVGVHNTDGILHFEVQSSETEYPYSYQGKTKTIENEPVNFIDTTGVSKDFPLEISRTQYICVDFFEKREGSCAETRMLCAYRTFVENLYNYNILTPTAPENKHFLSWQDWANLKFQHISFLLEKTENGAYIKMGKGNGQLQKTYDFTGASFLVKSLEAAVIFAQQKNFKTAEQIGRFFLQAENPQNSGLFRDNYHIASGQWGGYLGITEDTSYKSLINARCNGEAMIAYIQLYELLKQNNVVIPEFIELPKRVALFYLKNQIQDGDYKGCFGRWWKEDGTAENIQGTNGAYIAMFLLRLKPYIDSNYAERINFALHAASEYYLKMINEANFYGDTLDADAYDKESAAVLLRMCLDMYESTKNVQFKEGAVKAADFLLSWIWLYDIPFATHTPLGKEGFKTTGMTSVSVAHHHLDFYGMYLARDFLRLYKISESSLYRSLARDMIIACRQLMASPTCPLGKSPEFYGWQPEQINYTAWDYFDRSNCQKGFFDICIAWVPILTLSAYNTIIEENLFTFND